MVWRAGVMGDWHGHYGHFRAVCRTLKHAGIHRLYCVGDASFDWPGQHRGRTEKRMRLLLEQNDILYTFVGGNHDNWATLETLPANPDGTRRVADRFSYLPNGVVIEHDGVRIAGLGGAYSVDKAWRREGRDWWPQEEPTPEQAQQLIEASAGGVTLMLTHDVPMGATGLKGMSGLSAKTIERANQTRILLQDTVERVRPKALFAGHWHQRLRSELQWDDGTKTMVEVLAAEQSWAGNLVEVCVDDDGEVEVKPLKIQVTFAA